MRGVGALLVGAALNVAVNSEPFSEDSVVHSNASFVEVDEMGHARQSDQTHAALVSAAILAHRPRELHKKYAGRSAKLAAREREHALWRRCRVAMQISGADDVDEDGYYGEFANLFGINPGLALGGGEKFIPVSWGKGNDGELVKPTRPRYFVKSIPKSEAEVIREKLEAYTRYLEENPKTTLSVVVGLYWVKGISALTRLAGGAHVLVMKNMKPFADNEQLLFSFDLKGSKCNPSFLPQVLGAISPGLGSVYQGKFPVDGEDVDFAMSRSRPFLDDLLGHAQRHRGDPKACAAYADADEVTRDVDQVLLGPALPATRYDQACRDDAGECQRAAGLDDAAQPRNSEAWSRYPAEQAGKDGGEHRGGFTPADSKLLGSEQYFGARNAYDAAALPQWRKAGAKYGLKESEMADTVLGKQFELDSGMHRELLAQLERDVNFLAEQGFMDYSLLLYVASKDTDRHPHCCAPGPLDSSGVQSCDPTPWADFFDLHSIPVVGENLVLYPGIIDFFTKWSNGKAASNNAQWAAVHYSFGPGRTTTKQYHPGYPIGWDTIKPNDYRDRMVHFAKAWLAAAPEEQAVPACSRARPDEDREGAKAEAQKTGLLEAIEAFAKPSRKSPLVRSDFRPSLK